MKSWKTPTGHLLPLARLSLLLSSLLSQTLLSLLLGSLLLLTSCGDDYTLEDQARASLTPIHTDLHYFKDANGRYMFIHGANVSGSSKFPASFEPISYVGKPFPLEEADWNFRTLRSQGFNVIRLVMTWRRSSTPARASTTPSTWTTSRRSWPRPTSTGSTA